MNAVLQFSSICNKYLTQFPTKLHYKKLNVLNSASFNNRGLIPKIVESLADGTSSHLSDPNMFFVSNIFF